MALSTFCLKSFESKSIRSSVRPFMAVKCQNADRWRWQFVVKRLIRSSWTQKVSWRARQRLSDGIWMNYFINAAQVSALESRLEAQSLVQFVAEAERFFDLRQIRHLQRLVGETLVQQLLVQVKHKFNVRAAVQRQFQIVQQFGPEKNRNQMK